MRLTTPFRKSIQFLCLRLLLILLLTTSGVHGVYGQGNLLITPRRVVFEGTKKSEDLNLVNNGKDSATYSISIVQIRMKEDGSFERISDPDSGQYFADKNLRFFPRQVTLGPGESQVIKIQLYRANQLTSGEYRSHFYFRSVPKADPLGKKGSEQDSTAISVVLRPVFGISIPVIIRIGDTSSRVELSDLQLKIINDTLPNMSMTFNRSGNASIYGDLAVYHISTQGKETKVGVANGIAVYTPNTKRTFQFNLNRVPGVEYTSGTLRAIFSAPSDVKPERYAEAEVSLH